MKTHTTLSAKEMLTEAETQFKEAQQVLQAFSTASYLEQVVAAAQEMAKTLRQGGKILSCGNGGSACDAMHFAEELSGRFRKDRPALAALSLTDSSHMSCVANDYGFEKVFSRAVEAIGKENDLLLAISTSGRSPNILAALKAAKKKKMTCIALSAGDGNKLKSLTDIKILVPYSGYSDRIQEIHIKIIHTFVHLIEKQLFQ